MRDSRAAVIGFEHDHHAAPGERDGLADAVAAAPALAVGKADALDDQRVILARREAWAILLAANGFEVPHPSEALKRPEWKERCVQWESRFTMVSSFGGDMSEKPALQAGKDLAKPLVGEKIAKNHPDSP